MTNKFWIKILASDRQDRVDVPPLKKFLLSIDSSWTASVCRQKIKERFASNYGDLAHLTDSFSNLHDAIGAEIPDEDNFRTRYKAGAEQVVFLFLTSTSPKKRKASAVPGDVVVESVQPHATACRSRPPHNTTRAAMSSAPFKLKKPRLSENNIRAKTVARRTLITPETESEEDQQPAPILKLPRKAARGFARDKLPVPPFKNTVSAPLKGACGGTSRSEQRRPQELSLNSNDKSGTHGGSKRAAPASPTKVLPRPRSQTSLSVVAASHGSIKSFLEPQQETWTADDDSKFAIALRSGTDATIIYNTYFSQSHSFDFIMYQYRKYEDSEIKRYKQRPDWPRCSTSTPNWGDRENARLHRAFRAGLGAETTKRQLFRNFSDSAFEAKWKAYTAQLVRLGLDRQSNDSDGDSPPLRPLSTHTKVAAEIEPNAERMGSVKDLHTFSNGQTKLPYTPVAKISSKTASGSSKSAGSSRGIDERGLPRRQTRLSFGRVVQPRVAGKGKKATVDLPKITAELDQKYARAGAGMVSHAGGSNAITDNCSGEDDCLTAGHLWHHQDTDAVSVLVEEDEFFEDATSVVEQDSASLRGSRLDSEEPVWHDATDGLSSPALRPIVREGSPPALHQPAPKLELQDDTPEDDTQMISGDPVLESEDFPDPSTAREDSGATSIQPYERLVLKAVEIPVAKPAPRAFVTAAEHSDTTSIKRQRAAPFGEGPVPVVSPVSLVEKNASGPLTIARAETSDPIESDEDDGTPSLTSTAFLRRSKNAPRMSIFTFSGNENKPQQTRDINSASRNCDGQLRRQLTFPTASKFKGAGAVNAEDITRSDPLIEDADFDEDYLSQSHTLKEFVETSGPLFRSKKVQEQIEHEADKIRKVRAFDKMQVAQPGALPARQVIRSNTEQRSVAQSTAASTATKTDRVVTLASSVVQAPDDETCPTSPASSEPSISEWLTYMPTASVETRKIVQVAATQTSPRRNLGDVEVDSDDESDPIKDLKILDSQEIGSHFDALPEDMFGDVEEKQDRIKAPVTTGLKSALKFTQTQVVFPRAAVDCVKSNEEQSRSLKPVNPARNTSGLRPVSLSGFAGKASMPPSVVASKPPKDKTSDDEHYSGESDVEEFGLRELQREISQAEDARGHYKADPTLMTILKQIEDSQSEAEYVEESVRIRHFIPSQLGKASDEESSDDGSQSGSDIDDVWPKLLPNMTATRSQSVHSAKNPYVDLTNTPSPEPRDLRWSPVVDVRAKKRAQPPSPRHAERVLATPTDAERPSSRAERSDVTAYVALHDSQQRSSAEYNASLPSISSTALSRYEPLTSSTAQVSGGGKKKKRRKKKTRRPDHKPDAARDALTSSVNTSTGPETATQKTKAQRKAKKRKERRKRRKALMSSSMGDTSSSAMRRE